MHKWWNKTIIMHYVLQSMLALLLIIIITYIFKF